MKNIIISFLFTSIFFMLISCKEKPSEPELANPYDPNNNVSVGTVEDIDGNVYKTVKIGNQWWMAENLKVIHYRNGDKIPNVKSDDDWKNLTTDGYCVYDNEMGYFDENGLFYNAMAIKDGRKIAPDGWHISTHADWMELEIFLGMSQHDASLIGDDDPRGTNEGDKLKSESWFGGGAHSDEVGFNAIPAGGRNIDDAQDDGLFYGIGTVAVFGTTSEFVDDVRGKVIIGHGVVSDMSTVFCIGFSEKAGLSVRCIKD